MVIRTSVRNNPRLAVSVASEPPKIKASFKEKSTLQARVIPKFPINVVGVGAIHIDKSNGVYTFSANPFYPLGDAPNDGLTYGRIYGDWVEVVSQATYTADMTALDVRIDEIEQDIDNISEGAVEWGDITNKPATFPPTLPIPQSGVTDLTADLDALELKNTEQDARLGGVEAVNSAQNTAISGKADAVHTHVAAQVTDFSEAVDDRVSSLLVAGANVTLTYNDTANTLTVASTAAGGGGVEEAPTDGGVYARQNSDWTEIPGIGGISPTEYNYNAAAYVPPPNTNNLRLNNANQALATEMYLHHVNALNIDIANALRMLEPGNKILMQDKTNSANYQMYQVSSAITDFATYTTVPVTRISGGSPCTAGRVMIAAFGMGASTSGANPSDIAPLADGIAAPGVSTLYSRGDHVHPTDTSRAPLASPTFTGTPAAPTATAGTNTTQLATTAFVQAAVTAGGGFTIEDAQDAVGTILVDSATIDFTYADATPSITAIVKPASIDLTSHVTGSLPIANGGTGVTTGLTTKLDATHAGTGGAAHAAVTTSVNGFMIAADKTKLDGIATGATAYVHPTGDGNLHVPATSTTNNGKVLTAGATAGSLSWTTASVTPAALTKTDDTNVTLTLGGAPTTSLLAATSITAGWTGTLSAARGGNGTATGISAATQTALDGKAATSHTHAASSVTDFAEAVDDRVSSLLVAGTNITLSYNDVGNALTINASGGGGASVTISDTAPGSPTAGSLWFQSSSGNTFIWFDDGSGSPSAQWVQQNVGPAGPAGADGAPGDENVTGGHITIASSAPGSPATGDVWIDTT